MTNKPMLSVERELLEDFAGYGGKGKVAEPYMVEKLRALLNAQHAVCSNGILCQNSKCAECGGNGAYKPAAWERDIDYRPEELGSPETEPAAQHQCEPVAFQVRVKPWMLECFGEVISADRQERNHRFLEEALEMVQACACTATEAHQLVDYVYGRPVGEPSQEVGGVMVTLAALCLAHDMDMHAAGEVELARIWTKVEQIRAKQAAKPSMSPLPGAYPYREQPAPVAVVMPSQRAMTNRYIHDQETVGWNACLAEVARLNGVNK